MSKKHITKPKDTWVDVSIALYGTPGFAPQLKDYFKMVRPAAGTIFKMNEWDRFAKGGHNRMGKKLRVCAGGKQTHIDFGEPTPYEKQQAFMGGQLIFHSLQKHGELRIPQDYGEFCNPDPYKEWADKSQQLWDEHARCNYMSRDCPYCGGSLKNKHGECRGCGYSYE